MLIDLDISISIFRMQSPSLYLDQSHSLENLIKDIKSDINPSIIHPCVASFLPPLSLHNIETLGFPEDTTSQPENNFFTDLYESNLLSSSKKISNDLQSPYLSNCNIDPFQNITQDQLNSQAGLTAVRVADEDIGEDNDDKRSLIDELLCLFTPSDQKISIQKNKNKQKQFNTSLASNNYEKEDFNERQTTNKIFTSQNEDQFIDQSISSTVTFTNNSEIIDNIEFNDYASKRAQQFKKTMLGKKENLHDQRQNHKIARTKQPNVKINKKQTLMMKKLRKQITNTISIIQKRAIRNQNEDYYEYCWVFGCISCWFSLKSITVLYDIWLCWANSFIHQKEPLSETIKGVDRFEELIESIQSEYEKDPREKIKDQLELQGYLYQTKAVFKEITLNKALQFNRRANKSNETKQESGVPSSKSNIPINPQRSVNKKPNNIVNVSLKSSKESHKKQQIHPY